MQPIAKIPYAHPDDRDVNYVLYDFVRGDNRHSEYVVWTESSTGDRYWGHYFPYSDDREKDAMFRRAMKCMLFLAGRKHGLTMDEEEAFT